MAYLLALGICQEDDNLRVPRPVRKIRVACFNLTDKKFVSNFRLSKPLVARLIEELRPNLSSNTTRRNTFSVEEKVFCALRFFATGSYQTPVGNDELIFMSQQSVSKAIRNVAEAVNSVMLRRYIKFPEDRRMQGVLKDEFHAYCGLGGVLGAIDCTHVAITAPTDDGYHHERNFVNRKGFHSINVQLVCDMQQKILNVVARYPGGTHDAFIWRSSNLRTAFDRGSLIHGNGWLLGDSGYPLESWLHVPIFEPASAEEKSYNDAQALGRSVIERCNGTLKTRFRCLLKQRVLMYKPVMACKIINCCAVLHNMCIDAHLTWEKYELPAEDSLFNTNEDD